MYNLVSTWECKEPILKILRLEILATLNEHPTDEQTYLSTHIPISVAVHDTLSKEPVYLVDKNPKRLIKRFIEVLTEKQEAMAVDALKQHPYPLDFQMLPKTVEIMG